MTTLPQNRFADRAALVALWGPALAFLAVQVAFATTYGIFRDELYYLACAARLDWGYVDHPPLVAVLTALWTGVFGDGLRALRFSPARPRWRPRAPSHAAWVAAPSPSPSPVFRSPCRRSSSGSPACCR